jgi:hypothetical protein
MRKLIGAYLLGAIWTVGALGNACAQSLEARQLMEATNADRAQHGLGPLKWDPALARAAQRHADLMGGQRALSHQYGGEADLETRVGQEGAHFHVVAENLAAAATPDALEAEWMQSPGHRANILDPRLNEIGVGMVRQGGYLWAVEDFSAAVAVLGSSQNAHFFRSRRAVGPKFAVRMSMALTQRRGDRCPASGSHSRSCGIKDDVRRSMANKYLSEYCCRKDAFLRTGLHRDTHAGGELNVLEIVRTEVHRAQSCTATDLPVDRFHVVPDTLIGQGVARIEHNQFVSPAIEQDICIAHVLNSDREAWAKILTLFSQGGGRADDKMFAVQRSGQLVADV